MEKQCKCGSLDFFIKKQGNNTGLYCSMCGKWQKWLNKDEIRLFEHYSTPKKKKIKKTNADRIRSMTDEELAEFLRTTIAETGENMFLCSEYEETEHCKGHMCTECGAYLAWLKSEVGCE